MARLQTNRISNWVTLKLEHQNRFYKTLLLKETNPIHSLQSREHIDCVYRYGHLPSVRKRAYQENQAIHSWHCNRAITTTIRDHSRRNVCKRAGRRSQFLPEIHHSGAWVMTWCSGSGLQFCLFAVKLLPPRWRNSVGSPTNTLTKAINLCTQRSQ